MTKKIYILFISIVCTMALSINPVVIENYEGNNLVVNFFELLKKNFNTEGINQAILFFAIAFFLKYIVGKSKFYFSAAILSIFFSGATIFGISYSKFNDWIFINKNGYQMVLALLIWIAYYILFYYILKFIIDKAENWHETTEIVDTEHFDRIRRFINCHYGVCIFIFLLTCWLPYLISHYPGNVSHDGYRQLNMYFGYNSPTNHHPWLATLVIGSIMKLGRGINDNFGVFLYIFCQSIFCAFVFSQICKKIKNMLVPNAIKVFSVFFFGITPIWGAYLCTLVKDSLYFVLFSLFLLFYIEIIENREFKNVKQLLAFIVISFFVSHWRNEGIYIILVSIVFLLFIVKKRKRYVIISFVGLLISHLIFVNIIMPAMGVANGSSREMFSIPFQQTARYVKYFGDELTEEERETIDHVLDYEIIKEKYNPDISDAVKNTYRADSDEQLKAYFKLWLKCFFRHPGVYLQAFINGTYGYYYPDYEQKYVSTYQLYIMGEPAATGDMDIYYINNKERITVDNYCYFWDNLPVLKLFTKSGTYTWILLSLAMLLMRRKKYMESIALLPSAFSIAVCILSPVNGCLRYSLPVVASIPLLIAYTVSVVSKNNKKEIKS